MFKWGVLGTGNIAKKFVADLAYTNSHMAYAVGSRNEESAKNFADRFLCSKYYGSYEDLVLDTEIDAVYVASHSTMHYEHMLLALRAGKHVLCEKPFVMNAKDAKHIFEVAKEYNLLVMEAMWSRYLPIMNDIRESVRAIGDIKFVGLTHGRFFNKDPEFRLFSRQFGGGSLFDLGIYGLSMASMLLGKPKEIDSTALLGINGLDEQTSVMMKYESAQCSMTFSNTISLPNTAVISGENGRIEISGPFFSPQEFTVFDNHGNIIGGRINRYVGNGLREQALYFEQMVNSASIDSKILPSSEVVSILESMDTIANQIGISYE